MVSLCVYVLLISLWTTLVLPQNQTKQRLQKYLIDQPGCRIPYYDAFDPAITRYIFPPKNISCGTKTPNIFKQTGNYLYLNSTKYQCTYQPFWRRKPKAFEDDDQYKINPVTTKLTLANKITHENIMVTCKIRGKTYQYFFNFAQRGKVQFKLDKVVRDKPYFRILVLGIDNMSRLNFRRQMPDTYLFLRKNMGATELYGYNKIGYNSFPNIMAGLTGSAETYAGCDNETKRYDSCPFVWNEYAAKNYVTGYAEDSTEFGLFSYNGRKGFKYKAVDFDYRVFDQVARLNIGHYDTDLKVCFGNHLRVKKLLHFVKNFVYEFKDDPYFLFTWTASISHYELNQPRLIDQLYLKFLYKMTKDNILQNTALFLISDHGMRYGGIRKTTQGFVEECLPFFTVSLPNWFREQFPQEWQNLQDNKWRLTTPYDLHETFRHLNELGNFKKYTGSSSLGTSLFLPISSLRDCNTTGIPREYCTCESTTTVDLNVDKAWEIGKFVVSKLNEMVSTHVNGAYRCATLKLQKVENAVVRNSIVVSFVTIPGNGLFEAAVGEEGDGWSIIGTVSRLNLYGGQSECVDDRILKLYCFCILKDSGDKIVN